MTSILKDFNFTIAYLDDIIIFSKTLQEYLSHIRKVFKKLWLAKLSMKMSKCNFFSKEIQYLGHILSTTGIQPLSSKTHAIQHMQPCTTPKQVRAFLGLVGYYRKFIKGFAKIAKPLTWLTHQQVKFDWTSLHHTTFLSLKEAIIQAPILHYLDPNKNILSTQMHLMMHLECNFCRNMMELNFQYLSCHTHSQRHKKMEHNQTGGIWSLLCDS